MYLEQRIEALEKLVAELQKQMKVTVVGEVTAVETTEVEELAVVEETEQAKTYTLDDVREAVSAILSKDKSKKVALSGLLQSYGAKRVPDLAAEHYAEFIGKVEKGEY